MRVVTAVRIDPNVRVRGNQTYAGFEDVYGKKPEVGHQVTVFEPESKLSGRATVSDIDVAKELVYLIVDWSKLRVPSGKSGVSGDQRVTYSVTVGGQSVGDSEVSTGARSQVRVERELVPSAR